MRKPHPPLPKMNTTRMGIWTSLGLAQVLIESQVFDVISTIHRDWLPQLLQGSREVEKQTTHPKAKCQDCGVGGRAPPHRTPIGLHFNLPAARLGNFRLPMVTVAIPLPLDSPPWPDGCLGKGSFLQASQGLGGGSEMPAP